MRNNNIKFKKMHGLGNDFVIIDSRNNEVAFGADTAREIANRKLGVGCDQVILIENSAKYDCFMRIYNSDGSEVNSCGNASRCVARLLGAEKGVSKITLETRAGLLQCELIGNKTVAVNMGRPKFGWQEIPLSRESDTLNLNIEQGALKEPVAVNMGNPHIVFFANDLACIDIGTVGHDLENHELFPERVNVSIARIIDKQNIALKVWERGAGETLACGTAACATLVAANRRGIADKNANVKLPGGNLEIKWQDDDYVIMTGEVEEVFEGIFY